MIENKSIFDEIPSNDQRRSWMKLFFLYKPWRLRGIISVFLSILFCSSLLCKARNMETATEALSEVKLLPIYCVDTKGEKRIALTFNAAWGAEDIDQIVDTLKKYEVKVTFFVVGDWIRKYPDEARKLVEAGHEVANHSDKHPHVNNMSKEQVKKDIMVAHEAIKNVTGKDINLYRPPFGEYNNTVIEAAKECNYHVIQWDVDSLDWKEYGLRPLIDKVVNHKKLRPGSIILMHNGTKYTAAALDAIIKGLLDKGYKLVPVSELMIKGEYELDFEGRQHSLGQ